jgi:cobalamin biosynthesis protein CobT
MKMKNDRIFVLREAIVIIAQMLSGSGIKVTQRGTSAYVEPDATGKPVLINLPYIPDNATEELCEAIQGFLDHEVAHCLFTDFRAANKVAKNPKLHNLMNILEDARIEKRMAEMYRGCGSNLSNTGSFFLKKFTVPEMQKADLSGDKNAMVGILTVPLIRSMSGQELFTEFMRGKEHHVEEFYDMIKDLQPAMEAAGSTQDCIDLAAEIRKRLGDDGKGEGEGEGEGEPKPGKGGAGGKGKGKGPGGGKAAPKPAPGEGEEEEEGEPGAGEGEEEEGEGEGEEPAEGEENWEGEEDREMDGDRDPAAILSAIDKQQANGFDKEMSTLITGDAMKAAKHSEYLIFTKDEDVIENLQVGSDYKDSMFTELSDEVEHMVAPLQKDLERAIVARSRSRMTPGYKSGRLHSAGLAKLIVGDDRVFRRKHETTTKDVAVELVIDASGSMSGSKIHLAAAAAYALSSVLDRLKISNEVICFTTGPKVGGSKADEEERKIGRPFTRTESLYMPIIKGFGERIGTETKRRFGWLPNSRILRNNIDGECVEVAARRLMSRKETGKIMIVLSDGHPACAGDSGRVAKHLKSVVKDLERAGANVIGIGIQSDAVKQFYSKAIVINNADELPVRVMTELRHLLLPT